MSLEILQSSNDHSCIPQTIRSVSRGTHRWFQESRGKTELQTNSTNWELSNYGGIQIYGRRCLCVALYDMPRWISPQAVVAYRAACSSSWACCSVPWVWFAHSFVQLHATLLVECSCKLLAEEKRKSWCYLQSGERLKGWMYPYFKTFILVILKKTQCTENSELQLLRSAAFIVLLKTQPWSCVCIVSAVPRAPWLAGGAVRPGLSSPSASPGCPVLHEVLERGGWLCQRCSLLILSLCSTIVVPGALA